MPSPAPLKRALALFLALTAASAAFLSDEAAARPAKKRARAPVATPSPSPEPEGAFDADEIKFLRRLEQEGYIRHAACAEIANGLLTSSGLPRLGEATPVQGSRLDLDRRGERATPPWFVDSVVRRERPYEAYRIEGLASGTHWILKFTRELGTADKKKPPLRLETRLVFQPGSRLNQPICDLEAVEFKGGAWSGAMDLHDCIAIHELDAEAAITWVKDRALFPWVKQDCDLGLHYFKSAKDELIEEAKRRVR